MTQTLIEELIWIYRFHWVRYMGILIMMAGPLFFVYSLLFLQITAFHFLIGFVSSFISGLLIWIIGNEPYEQYGVYDHIEFHPQDLEKVIEFYGYVMRFNPVKYFGICIMICGSLFVIYRTLFQSGGVYELFGGLLLFNCTGMVVWSLGYDPYK